MWKSIVALSMGALMCWSCGQSSNNEDASGVSAFRDGSVQKTEFGSCDTVTNKGVAVALSIWEPSDSGAVAKKIRGILTEKIISRLNSYADSASIAAHPEATKSAKAAFEVFEKNYNDFRKDFPEAPGCWQVELSGDTVMTTAKVLFYELGHYAFTGGAHPNSFTSFHAFDGKTGVEVEMKDFVVDSVALLKVVEKKFREVEKLAPEADLEAAGYFLQNHHFFVPANYVFTPQGVLFYYNPYEIAAYVRGAIEFTIPYAALEGIVKKDAVF
nr:DUF3298 and DUF4163 domain-containing protein [uncultured Dyadobacter sp.]